MFQMRVMEQQLAAVNWQPGDYEDHIRALEQQCRDKDSHIQDLQQQLHDQVLHLGYICMPLGVCCD